MALTTHWDWRGFGFVSPKVRRRFDELDSFFDDDEEPQRFTDEYLWIPDSEINVKFRDGIGLWDGLKFKRFHGRVGDLEKWTEPLDEVFPFPLSKQAWMLLLAEVKAAHGKHVEPPDAADRTAALRFLRSIDSHVQTLKIVKERRSKIWGKNRNVKVELAEILSPKRMTSVGLEIWDPRLDLTDHGSITLLQEAIQDLKLAEEHLEVMNYLDLVKRCVE